MYSVTVKVGFESWSNRTIPADTDLNQYRLDFIEANNLDPRYVYLKVTNLEDGNGTEVR